MPENLKTDQRLRGPQVVSLAYAERHSEIQLHSELSVRIRDAVVGSFCEIGHQVVRTDEDVVAFRMEAENESEAFPERGKSSVDTHREPVAGPQVGV